LCVARFSCRVARSACCARSLTVGSCVALLLLLLQVRSYIRTIAKPGIPLTQLCETLEDSVRNLIEARGLDAGVLF
jgi:hypothetical protein